MPERRHHCESHASITAPPELIFEFIDTHNRLSSHMSGSSWMMGGGSMKIEVDARAGRAVGSRILLSGSAFGVTLFVEEAITEHQPPLRKTWETIGTPQLIVIGSYRMGVELSPVTDNMTLLRVFIDYDLPAKPPGSWMGWLFAGTYARGCTRSMAADVAAHFAPQAAKGPQSTIGGGGAQTAPH